MANFIGQVQTGEMFEPFNCFERKGPVTALFSGCGFVFFTSPMTFVKLNPFG